MQGTTASPASRGSSRTPAPPTGGEATSKTSASDEHTPPGADGRGAVSKRSWLWILLAAAVSWPWLVYRFTADFHHGAPAFVALLSGAAILGAAFLLSWAAEAFQLDVSQALALALLSLIAVLPEYAVDVVFAWRAASDPTQAPYAVANMTGANRLLIGIGWSSVVLMAWWRTRRAWRHRRAGTADRADAATLADTDVAPRSGTVTLEPSQALELAALGLATLYSFFIPLKGGIGILDAVVLFSLFAVYAWATARTPAEEPHLVGPAAAVGALAPGARRLATLGLFAYAAVAILLSAEPFAEGLVQSGTSLGIDEFLLVQWLAPLASETPEFLVALLFAWRGLAGAGLRTLIASKVNQWTLLVGTLGVAYSLALGTPADLPLVERQAEELLLTSAQSLFALALIANFDLSVREALLLMGTFLVQAFFPSVEVRLAMAGLYFVAGVGLIVLSRERRQAVIRLPGQLREIVWRRAAATG
jgi:cation:H+ antiporter